MFKTLLCSIKIFGSNILNYNMPKKVIENTEVISLPYLPQLSMQKNTRVITKHYCNTALYLNPEHASLLTWLIYQSNTDNSFKYEERLLNRYCTAIKEANDLYKGHNHFRADVKIVRGVIKELIERGYILPTSEAAIFIINPMFTYHPSFCKRNQYKKVCENYNLYINSKGIRDSEGLRGIVFPSGWNFNDKSVSFADNYRKIK